MSTKGWVAADSEAWTAASTQFGANIAGQLHSGWQSFYDAQIVTGPNVGSDPAGGRWGADYKKSANLVAHGWSDLVNASLKMAQLLEKTGFNYGFAEHASDPRGLVPLPPDRAAYPLHPVSPVPVIADADVVGVDLLGDPSSVPDNWKLIAAVISAPKYPDADLASVHSVAESWGRAAVELDVASGRAQEASQNIVLEQGPEVQDALAACDAMQHHFETVANQCRALQRSCQQFITHVTQARAKIEPLIAEVDASVAASAESILASIFTDEPAADPDPGVAEAAAAESASVVVIMAGELEGAAAVLVAGDSEVIAVLDGLAPLLSAEAADGEFTIAGAVLTSGMWNDETLAVLRLRRDASGLWGLGPGPRGYAAEDLLIPDHNLPPNFPVIDDIDAGNATSIKTIDLLGTSRQNPGTLRSTLRGYITKLAGFDGARYAGANVPVGSITSKTLLVGVQEGSMSPAQATIFDEMKAYAQTHHVTLKVVDLP